VRDVGKERRLLAVDLLKRLGAASFFFVRPGIGWALSSFDGVGPRHQAEIVKRVRMQHDLPVMFGSRRVYIFRLQIS
jgi:hypothetical protein